MAINSNTINLKKNYFVTTDLTLKKEKKSIYGFTTHIYVKDVLDSTSSNLFEVFFIYYRTSSILLRMYKTEFSFKVLYIKVMYFWDIYVQNS